MLSITTVAGDGESGDSIVFREKFASCHSQLQSDLGDLNLGVRLTVTDLLLFVLLGLVAEDGDL